MFTKLVTFIRPDRVFPFLVAFRWASLIPALVILIMSVKNQPEQILYPLLVFGIALLANLFISVASRQLNRLVIDHPALLAIDLIFSAGILAITGGSHSPYYLYALSPLLAGAFFFQMRGAVVASMLFTPLYFMSSFLSSQNTAVQADIILLTTQLTGIWLIPILFAYSSILLKDINQAREELNVARDELAEKHENLARSDGVVASRARSHLCSGACAWRSYSRSWFFKSRRCIGRPCARRTWELARLSPGRIFSTNKIVSTQIRKRRSYQGFA
jgi:hypothetical protein